MKKLLAILAVLSITTAANAGLTIGVGGYYDQAQVMTFASDTSEISLYSDGLALSMMIPSEGIYLVPNGPGMLDISSAINHVIPGGIFEADWTEAVGDIFIDLSIPGVPIPPVPVGVAVDGIIFHCEGWEDVVLVVVGDASAEIHDTQLFRTPEPMTFGLLALGSLFLRRRRK
jgi:hypothetical protein